MSTDMTDRQQTDQQEEVQTTGHLGLKIVGILVLVIVALVVGTFAVRGQELPEDPAQLIALLASDDAEMARRAGEELARKPRATLPYLEKAVTAEGARQMLEEQGVAATEENVRQLRINAIGTLVDVRTSQALAAITPLVTAPDKEIQLEAISAVSRLAFLWREEAANALAEAFESDDIEVVREAGTGLQTMDYPGATEVLRTKFRSEEGVQAVVAARMLYEEEGNEAAAEFLIRSLSHSNEAVAQSAQQSIMKLGPELVPNLVEAETAEAEQLISTVRDDVIIPDLRSTLDAKKAAELLNALGHIADETSVEVMQESFTNTKNESGWRLSASEAMALAARRNPQMEERVVNVLNEMLANEAETDDRIKIGAAIALARLGKAEGVDHLLQELDQFQADIADEQDRTKIQDLHALRIRAQEALAEAGSYGASRDMIVNRLMTRAEKFEERLPELRGRINEVEAQLAELRKKDNPDTAKIGDLEGELAALKNERAGGFIILWAASETLGALQVEEFVPNLGEYLTARHTPQVRVDENGTLRATGSDKEASLVLQNWQDPTDAAVEEQVQKLRTYDYVASVRTSAAIGLDKIGGARAVQFLKQAHDQEQEIVRRLEANRLLPDYYRRAAVINAFQAQHEGVLFYLRSALRRREDI